MMAHADERPREGALCFGKKGVTDLRTLTAIGREIRENRSQERAIGVCRLVEVADTTGEEIEVHAGKVKVAVLTTCGGTILARGIASRPDAIQVGDRAEILARSLEQLWCRRRSDTSVECAFDAGDYEPLTRYEIRTDARGIAYDVALRGAAAAKLLRGRQIRAIQHNYHCDRARRYDGIERRFLRRAE